MSEHKQITLSLSNNQAVHLWGVLVSQSQLIRQDLISRKVFKRDGTPNKKRTYYSDYVQEQIDNLALCELVYKHLEGLIEFPEADLPAQT